LLKLDELMAHLRSVRELATRLATLQGSTPVAPAGNAQKIAPAPPAAAGKAAANDIAKTLNSLAERLSAEHRKSFKLGINGLADLPQAYQGTVKDVLIQLLRNAAVHGIEAAEVRRAQSKAEVGLVRVDLRRVADGFELVCEDDGAGLNPEQLKAAAVRKQM